MTCPPSLRLALLLFFAVAVTAGAAGASPPPAAPALEVERLRIPYEKLVLANGLTVLVHQDHSVPLVAVNLWYHVGSRNERRGRTGFAHLFEHFFFNGSEHHPSGFREAMDDLGANNRNGTTSNDRTNFFEDVPTSALERTLYLEADRMGFLRSHISQEMLERERGVVQNEKRQGENQPYGRVFDRVVEAVYPYSHPYSWPTIGSMADLDAARLDDVREWYDTYYGPNNCVLALAGDVTVARARELAERYFGSIPPGPPLPRHQAWVPALDGDLRDSLQDRVPQARIYRVYQAPPWADPRLRDLELLAQVLSGSKSARLDRRLVYERQLATEVSAEVWDKELASNVILTVTVKEGVDPAAAERELDAVLAELLDKGPTAGELQRAKSRLLAQFARGSERLGGFGGRSDVLAESMTYGGDPEAYLARLRRIAAATPQQVLASGRASLRAHSYTLLVTPFPELAAGATTVDRTELPDLGAAPEVPFPRVQRATLANGLQVMLLERHGAPLVHLTLAVDAGFASDRAEQAGAASLALDLLDEGTTSRDAFGIADALDALGAQLSTESRLDLSLVRLEALASNLRPSLELFADVALHPAFPPDLVAVEKRRRLADIEQEQADPLDAGFRLAPPLLYGSAHAYGKPLTGSGYRATVEPLRRDDLAAWHRAWFQPEGSTLIVAGDVAMTALLPELERAFGGWPRGRAPSKAIATVENASRGRVFLVDRPGAPQSVIVAAQLSEPGGRPEDLAMETVMRLFGGMSTSRLNRNLRLDKHWSYGTIASLATARGQRPLLVIAPVQTDKTKEAIVEVAREIEGIAGKRPIAGDELASIQRNMVLRLAGRFETLTSLEGAALQMVNLGYPETYFYDYAANVAKLGAGDLAAAAARYVRPGEQFWLVLGDLAKVEAGVRELRLGEVTRLDGEGKPRQ